jgi:anaerobic magnesium-protoporphyrin IX monomethyl ester cyclase
VKLLLIREVSEVSGDISQGIGLIGTIAKEEATVRIIDNNSYHVTHSVKTIIKKIREYNPDAVGFHVHTHNMYKTGELIKEIRRYMPHICLIGGGIHAFFEPEEILDLGVDIVAVEEADLTINPLLRALKGAVDHDKAFKIGRELSGKLSQIPGLIYFDDDAGERKNSGRPNFITDLDALPFIDHSIFNLEDYILKPSDGHYVTNTLVTQRGCPFSCSFCQGVDEEGAYRMLRENSAEYRLKYMKYLVDKFGHNYIMFYDANFTINHKKTLEFCNLLIESGLNKSVTFFCETNVKIKFDAKLAKAMAAAGCTEIALGIERLTKESQEQILKVTDYNLIMERIHNIHSAGIRITANALIGFPFDTVESIEEEGRRFNGLLDRVDSIMVSVVLPLPGTKVYEETGKKKWYVGEEYGRWRPPFYQRAYHYVDGNAWHANYFDLDKQTMAAIRNMRERMHAKSIAKVNSRLISILFFFVELLAKVSLFLFNRSPMVERVVFAPIEWSYNFLWKFMVQKYYVSR